MNGVISKKGPGLSLAPSLSEAHHMLPTSPSVVVTATTKIAQIVRKIRNVYIE